MSFALIILIRVLFVACMVFILGYLFGSFGKRPVLKTISRVSAVLLIVLFAGMNILFMGAAAGGHRHHGPWNGEGYGKGQWQRDCPFEDGRQQPQDTLGKDLTERNVAPWEHAAKTGPGEGSGSASVTLISSTQ